MLKLAIVLQGFNAATKLEAHTKNTCSPSTSFLKNHTKYSSKTTRDTIGNKKLPKGSIFIAKNLFYETDTSTPFNRTDFSR